MTYATNILDATLGEYAGFGFRLQEEGDHLVDLKFKEQVVAHLTQYTTVENIKKACQEYMEGLNAN